MCAWNLNGAGLSSSNSDDVVNIFVISINLRDVRVRRLYAVIQCVP